MEDAAVTLFERDGFAATTVPQIAKEAGLTTRTFFRHFADKRDVMFLRDREFPSVVEHSLRGTTPDDPPVSAVRLGLDAVCDDLEAWRDQFARRQRIIRAEPALRERDLLSSHHLADAMRSALVARGASTDDARTLAGLAVTCFDLAVEVWLERQDHVTLAATVNEVWERARRVMG